MQVFLQQMLPNPLLGEEEVLLSPRRSVITQTQKLRKSSSLL